MDKALGGFIRQVRCVIVLGGNSIQGSGTFDTGAEDALCSGPTRPARPVSPEDAATQRHKCSEHAGNAALACNRVLVRVLSNFLVTWTIWFPSFSKSSER